MKALVWNGVGKVAVEDVPRPAIGAAHEVIVRVTATTICGSDLRLYHASIPAMRKGDILGHECMGIVDEVGDGVTNVGVGDRVVVSAVIADGTCWFCQRGLYSACDGTNRSALMEKMHGTTTGGIFGYSHSPAATPVGRRSTSPCPSPMSTRSRSRTPCRTTRPSSCPTSSTGWHATELGRVAEGEAVAVWGCGPVGLMAQEWACYRRASQVIAVDRVPHRLALAASRGAIPVNFDDEDVIARVQELTDGRGADVCVEAVGFRYVKSLHHRIQKTLKLETDSIDALNECIRAGRKYGWVAIVGDFIGFANQYPIGAFMEKGLQAGSGQVHVQRYWGDLLGIIERGEFEPTFLISHRWRLERAAEAYEMFDNKEDNAVKVILTVSPG